MKGLQARTEITQASRILALQGIMDAFGHVSRRCPERADHFLMARSMAPALVTLEDVVTLNFDGTPISAPGTRVFLERFLHAEIYRAQPTVQAIVHSHAPVVVPFTVVPEARLRPICHVCGFLEGAGTPFDVADHAGPASDLLICNSDLGKRFAEHMGASAIGLMRAHGFTAVGQSIPQAVFRAIYTARNCQIQLSASALGTPTFLTPGEAQACEETTGGQADRAWDLWLHELAAHGAEETS